MKNEAKYTRHQNEIDLLECFLTYKLDSGTLANSEVAIKEICRTVDSLKDETVAYRLLSITSNNKSLLHLILKREGWAKYHVFTWEIDEKIEKGIEAKLHDSGQEDLLGWMEETANSFRSEGSSISTRPEDNIAYIITESLTGYLISKKKFTDHCQFLYSGGEKTIKIKEYPENSILGQLFNFYKIIKEEAESKQKEILETISNFVQSLDCEKLSLNITNYGIDLKTRSVGVGKITRVIQNNNARTYQVKILDIQQDSAKERTIVTTAKAGVEGNYIKLTPLGGVYVSETRPPTWNDNKFESFARIPYNYIDEGRIILGTPRADGTVDVIVGPDPKVDSDPENTLKASFSKFCDILARSLTKLSGSKIVDGKTVMVYDGFEASVAKESPGVKPLQVRLKALKKMVDEYQYLVKKQESIGTDVKISDKIIYNHKEGKVQYNDFSVSVNDELLKSKLYQTFDKYLITYYRGETTEEQILNEILDKIFEDLKHRINSFSNENSAIKILLNGNIEINLEIKTSKNKAKLIYLNGQRFNRNEVLVVLREITCYRSQDEANRFISNIGRMGLSVYIGITSGYETDFGGSKKLFKFKKLKGRSNYSLILDTIEIPIKGKELINTLFNKFIGEPISGFGEKIPKIIFESVENSTDYVKYRFLIDSTYESFKTRSQEFLNKKVADVEGEFVKYYNANGKRMMSAITLIGMSRHRYVIAYDSKDSYVFIDPEISPNDKNVYQNGKYVCMIDQSSIKSNIGFDTVISKLLALKNDSVIARTIYNLEEEINGDKDQEDQN